MTGKTHQLIGITCGLGYLIYSIAPVYSPATLSAVLVGSSLMALLPDIDQPGGKLWQMIPLGKVFGKIADPFLEHRNLTHSILGVTMVGFLVWKLFLLSPSYWGISTNIVFVSMMLSYASHLLADMVTVQGIPLFFPYQKMFGIPPKPFDGIRIVTGKWFENLVIFPLVNIILVIIIYSKWDEIKIILLK